MARRLKVDVQSWPIRGEFRIARGAKTQALVVVAEIAEGSAIGRGECVPYARYGESVERVASEIEALRADIENGLTRETLQNGLSRSYVDLVHFRPPAGLWLLGQMGLTSR